MNISEYIKKCGSYRSYAYEGCKNNILNYYLVMLSQDELKELISELDKENLSQIDKEIIERAKNLLVFEKNVRKK